jgi:hypothetical protein
MTLDGSLSFARVIEEHLELKRRNSGLEPEMPIDRYRIDDPFENHPLFKSEEQARLEESLSGTEPMSLDDELVLAWPAGEETDPVMGHAAVAQSGDNEDTLWGRSREFDWGD